MAQATIQNVAEKAGVSISSVSRILRGGRGHSYSPETCARVEDAVRDLGYRANAAAQMLSRGARTMIGMSVHFSEHPYLNRFLSAVHRELLKHNYDPVFLDSEQLADESSAQPFPPPHMLAGFISMGIDLQENWPRHYSALCQDVPIVALQTVSSQAAKHIDVIQVDCKSAYHQAFEHLRELGHRRVAYVGMLENPCPADAAKHTGWRTAARESGNPPEYCLPWKVQKHQPVDPLGRHSDFLYQPESRETMKEIVARLKAFPEPVTALMCGSDEVAIALQSYLQAQGWNLPRDLSIIGYDGISLGEYVYPSLTTIAPDYLRMAEAAVNQLIARISRQHNENQDAPQKIFVTPELIVRSSTTML